MFSRWSSPEAVFHILKEISRGQPCDISGIVDYRMLDRCGGIQWPLPHGETAELERRLFEDGEFYHPDKRARFIFDTSRPPAETTSAQFPYVLLTGRGTSAQWHTQTRTSKSAVLRQLYPENVYIEISPGDAEAERLKAGDIARVISRRGSIEAKVVVTATVQPSQLFIPMHYPTVNQLTYPSFDPHSRQPSYKHAAVRLERIENE
jgi:predicted molibdopterin-dependent oxidoreductase YjgC